MAVARSSRPLGSRRFGATVPLGGGRRRFVRLPSSVCCSPWPRSAGARRATSAWVAGSAMVVAIRSRRPAGVPRRQTCPLVSRDADGWYRVHHLWEEAVERIFSNEERAGMRQRALELFQRRRRDVAHGLERAALGRRRGVGVACRALVHDTAGALPVDTAARWLADAPEDGADDAGSPAARDRPPPRPRLRRPRASTAELDAVIDEYLRTAATTAGRSSPSSSGWPSPTCAVTCPGSAPSTSGRDRCPTPTTSRCCASCVGRCGRRPPRWRAIRGACGGGDRGDVTRRRAGADQRARRPASRQHAVPVRPGRRGGADRRADARLAEPVRPHAACQGALAGG